MKCLTTGLVLVLSVNMDAAVADAQKIDHVKAIAECAVIKDSLERLRCFDDLAEVAASALPGDQPSQESGEAEAEDEKVKATGERINFQQVVENLSEKRTKFQREAFWGGAEGTVTTVSGKVRDVTGPGWVLNGQIRLDTEYGVRVTCMVQESLNSALGSVELGENLACTGELFSYVLLGGLSITLDEAKFSK